jgi:hypothetical protein
LSNILPVYGPILYVLFILLVLDYFFPSNGSLSRELNNLMFTFPIFILTIFPFFYYFYNKIFQPLKHQENFLKANRDG